MKMKHLMTVALGAVLLSCQGPAAVLAQEAAPGGMAASPHAAITEAHRARALDVLDRRLAHYVMVERIPAIRARLDQRRGALMAVTDPEAFRQALNAELLAASRDKHLQVWIEGRSRDEVEAAGEQPTLEQLATAEAAKGWGVRDARVLDGGVAYLNLASFSGHPDSPAAIDAVMGQLAGARALVLDLRENLGGGEPSLRQLMGHFAPGPMRLEDIQFRRCRPNPEDPEDCIADGRDTLERFANPVAAPAFPDQPILVLVGPATFSAAEAVAYDLQAAGRAVVIGETTGGGANPSVTMDLGPWFTVVMPIGEARHPLTGTNWEGAGVKPDVVVPVEQALDEALRRLG